MKEPIISEQVDSKANIHGANAIKTGEPIARVVYGAIMQERNMMGSKSRSGLAVCSSYEA